MQNQVYFFVYRITCRENNKCYIGVSKNTETRFKKHRYDARRSSPCHIHRAMRKYGVNQFDFEVIYGSKDEKYIREEMEPYFIHLYDSRRTGYNCTDGGEGGFNPTEETRQKLRARFIRKQKLSWKSGLIRNENENERSQIKKRQRCGEEIG